jgi:hypothetical protein
MKLKKPTIRDAAEIYELFREAQIDSNNSGNKKSGFFEYPLTEEDIKTRLGDNRFSLMLMHDGRAIAYLLAYPIASARDFAEQDGVLRQINSIPENIYVDQLNSQWVPAHVIGRFMDAWTNLLQEARVPGIFSAIPQKPWVNLASRRQAITRGYQRAFSVQEKTFSGELELGIYAKPLWLPKTEIELARNMGGLELK